MSNPSGDSLYSHPVQMDDVYRTTTTAMPSSSRNVLGTLKTFVGGAVEDPEEKEAFLDVGPLTR